ncbi:MAG: response regulator [Rhodospirillaceae bacterium]
MSEKTVLVVDDSRLARNIFKRVLKSVEPDWLVEEADGAHAAMEIVGAKLIDHAFLDVNMPHIDGLELGRMIRARLPDLPITFVTANVQASTEEAASQIGATVVAKPLDEAKLWGVMMETGLGSGGLV